MSRLKSRIWRLAAKQHPGLVKKRRTRDTSIYSNLAESCPTGGSGSASHFLCHHIFFGMKGTKKSGEIRIGSANLLFGR